MVNDIDNISKKNNVIKIFKIIVQNLSFNSKKTHINVIPIMHNNIKNAQITIIDIALFFFIIDYFLYCIHNNIYIHF